MDYGLDFRDSIPGRSKKYCLRRHVQTVFGALTVVSNKYRDPFSWVTPELEADHLSFICCQV
jgi:hypothetical protein